VHRLEFLDFADRLSDRFVDAVKIEDGIPIMKAPRAQSPLDDLGVQMVRLHIAGTVRALAGALDCMSGAIIGVLALPTSILKADFGGVRGILNRMAAKNATAGEQVQANFAEKFEDLITSAGPSGWLDWELAFRNMLVHRGRRIDLGQYVPRTPILFDQRGRAIPRVRVVNQLARDPGRSEVEVFLEPAKPLVLTEDAGDTLNGLLNSTKSLIEGTAQELVEVWRWRRDNPDALPQPKAQWPNGVASEGTAFSGYAPGSVGYNPGMMSTHPVVTKRMSAAALFDQTRDQWKTFD
jgi:hypothetical protein